jgi:hypothetical protein
VEFHRDRQFGTNSSHGARMAGAEPLLG